MSASRLQKLLQLLESEFSPVVAPGGAWRACLPQAGS